MGHARTRPEANTRVSVTENGHGVRQLVVSSVRLPGFLFFSRSAAEFQLLRCRKLGWFSFNPSVCLKSLSF